jgi:methionyl-tRNA formyltransferase
MIDCKNKIRLLILGYSHKETKIYSSLKKKYKKGIVIKNLKRKILLEDLKEYDLIISFGYRRIIKRHLLKSNKKIINLHMSYLPYNRGAYPNYWSWVKKTPHGVTIHYIDKKIDSGPILFQKKILMSAKKYTFKSSYKKLFFELENLFIKNIDKILNKVIMFKKQKLNLGNINFKKDFKYQNFNWNQNIFEYLKHYNKSLK